MHYNFQGSVWTYTFANGPGEDVVFFQSPQRTWTDRRKSLVLRQTNSDARDRAWINRDPSLVKRCGEDQSIFPTLADAHAVIVRDGWAAAIQPSCQPAAAAGEDGSPLVPYHRGERVWVEDSFSPADGDDTIPVVSIDTLENYIIPVKYVCFVPQYTGRDEDGDRYYAAPAGPVRNVTSNGKDCQTQCLFKCLEGNPQATELAWDTWDVASAGRRELDMLRVLDSTAERRRIFRQHWDILSRELSVTVDDDDDGSDAYDLGNPNLCRMGRLAEPERPEDKLERMQTLGMPTPNPNAVCNIGPNCDAAKWKVRLSPDETANLEDVKHYHIQDYNMEDCPGGTRHKPHCVLWNNKTLCAVKGKIPNHTCCVPLSQIWPDETKQLATEPRRMPGDYSGMFNSGDSSSTELGGSGALSPSLQAYQKYRLRQHQELEEQRRRYRESLTIQQKTQ